MGAPRVLVVEDDHDLRTVMVRHLAGEGYFARGAGTFREGQALLTDWSPDVVLMDIQLPDGSGHDLCALARSLTAAPIIYVTCMGAEESVLRGFDLGGDDYVTKPFAMTVLSARIAAQLRRLGGAAGRVEVPPLSIDMVTGTVILEGRRVELSKKELQLLVFFATHLGRGFTNAELLDAVWLDSSGVESNTVRVHVSRLRRKLQLGEGAAFGLTCTDAGRYVFQRLRLPVVVGMG
jgi:DNA-binding response OmpR family regulator